MKIHPLKLFGLCIPVSLILMAISASASRAEVLEDFYKKRGAFLENGAALTTLKTGLGEVDVLEQLEIPSLGIEIHCTNFKVKQIDFLGNGAGEEPGIAHGEILYEGCSVYGTNPTLTLIPECVLYETLADRTAKINKGSFVSKFLLAVFLHKLLDFDDKGKLIAELEKGTFIDAEIFMQIYSEKCTAIPNGVIFKGITVLELGSPLATKQLVKVADLTLFPNEFKFGENRILLLGSMWVGLSSGNAWGIC